MSQNSVILGLPFIQAAQAQKHLTHNEAIDTLDALTQIAIIEERAQPPVGATEGDRYLVAANATSDWAGRDNAIALSKSGGWSFFAPQVGWQAWNSALNTLIVWDGSTWTPVTSDLTNLNNLDGIGLGTTYDTTNRLSVSSDATLLNHAGAGHQLKLNKSTATDTSSLMFQTGFSGRAEVGTTGSDDLEFKVSDDGTTFKTGLHVSGATGVVSFPSGVTGLTDPSFGDSPAITADYAAARGTDLVTNGTGLLGNTYNFPASFTFEQALSPNLPGSFAYTGHYNDVETMQEFLPVDPNLVYRLSTYIRQEDAAGDWSAFPDGARHQQMMGLLCFDVDQQEIKAVHHTRYAENGVDSMTTLAAPLKPGDTVVQVSDATGWNATNNSAARRGITIFGYKSSGGQTYTHYSRYTDRDLFDLSGVDKVNNTITLNAPLPASMGNPDATDGSWPTGTSVANTSGGSTYKYAFFSGLILNQVDTWYGCTNHIGGIDESGTNRIENFPPGTAFVKVFWLPNYSNQVGGWNGFPDTGANHRVLYAGVSVTPEPLAASNRSADGGVDIKVPTADFATGQITLQPQTVKIEEK